MVVTEKMKEESRLRKEAQKVKVGMVTELSTFCEQMEKAKADVVAEFRASQSFINACAVYYDDEFEDYLKQVRSVHPDLDLSKISLDNPMPMTLVGGDTVDEESDDSVHIEEHVPKNDDVVIAQPDLEGLVIASVPSIEDLSTQDAQNPSTMDSPLV